MPTTTPANIEFEPAPTQAGVLMRTNRSAGALDLKVVQPAPACSRALAAGAGCLRPISPRPEAPASAQARASGSRLTPALLAVLCRISPQLMIALRFLRIVECHFCELGLADV